MTWQSARQPTGGLMAQGAANLDKELARRRGSRVTPAYIDSPAAQPAPGPNTPSYTDAWLRAAPGSTGANSVSQVMNSAPNQGRMLTGEGAASGRYKAMQQDPYNRSLGEDIVNVLSTTPQGRQIVREVAGTVENARYGAGQAVGAGRDFVENPPRAYMKGAIDNTRSLAAAAGEAYGSTSAIAERAVNDFLARDVGPMDWAPSTAVGNAAKPVVDAVVENVKPVVDWSGEARDKWLAQPVGPMDWAPSTAVGNAMVKYAPSTVAGEALKKTALAPLLTAPSTTVGEGLKRIATDVLPMYLEYAPSTVAARAIGAGRDAVVDALTPDRLQEQRRSYPMAGRPAPESAYLFENQHTGTPDFTDEADMDRMTAMTRYIAANGSDKIIPGATPGYETLTAGYGGSGGSDYPHLQWRRPYGGEMPGEPYAEGPQQSWSSNDVDRYRALQGSIIPVEIPPYQVEIPPYTPPEPARSRFRMVIPSYGQ